MWLFSVLLSQRSSHLALLGNLSENFPAVCFFFSFVCFSFFPWQQQEVRVSPGMRPWGTNRQNVLGVYHGILDSNKKQGTRYLLGQRMSWFGQDRHGFCPLPWLIIIILKILIYLAAPGLMAHRIFDLRRGMLLVESSSLTRDRTQASALEASSLSHWTTRNSLIVIIIINLFLIEG